MATSNQMWPLSIPQHTPEENSTQPALFIGHAHYLIYADIIRTDVLYR